MSAEMFSAQVMSREQAERVTEQIAYRIDSITENYEVVMSLMRDALARNAHEALGYASPGAYVAERFGKSMQTLSAALRREFVLELSDAGMSTRAIAPVFDISHVQVSKDLKAGVNPVNTSPYPVEVDGFTVDHNTGEILDGHTITGEPVTTEHTVTEKVRTITGLDGKEYKRPEPAAPRAEAITSQFTSAIAELNRVMARLRRISDDKNFARNKEQVASMHASDLYRTISELETLANEIS